MLSHRTVGEGPPLLLVHGIGSRYQVWDPLLPELATRYAVTAIDLPGFGDSAPLPEDADVSGPGLAAVVAKFCAEQGIERPHVAGNSLGGWIALELARSGVAASATGICPAGLWNPVPDYTLAELWVTRRVCRLLQGNIDNITGAVPFLPVLAAPHIFGKPWKVAPAEFAADVKAFGSCPGFDRTLEAFKTHRFIGGRNIEVPVTIAIGGRDVLLNKGCRERDQLPDHARWVTMPGCGHTPMHDDPDAVVRVIVETAG